MVESLGREQVMTLQDSRLRKEKSENQELIDLCQWPPLGLFGYRYEIQLVPVGGACNYYLYKQYE